MQPAVKLAYSRDTPATYEVLDERYGARIETMLAHWLDDEDLAARLRQPILLAIARREVVAHDPAAVSEDWMFGQARHEARVLIGPEGIAGVIPVMRKPVAPPPAEPDEFDYLDEPDRERSFQVPPRWIWFGAFMALVGAFVAYGYLYVADNPAGQIAAVRPVPSVPEPAAGPPPGEQIASTARRSDEPARPAPPRPAILPAQPPPPFAESGPTDLAGALPTVQPEPEPKAVPPAPVVASASSEPPAPASQATVPPTPPSSARPAPAVEPVLAEPAPSDGADTRTAIQAEPPPAEPATPPRAPPPLQSLEVPVPPQPPGSPGSARTTELAAVLPAFRADPPPPPVEIAPQAALPPLQAPPPPAPSDVAAALSATPPKPPPPKSASASTPTGAPQAVPAGIATSARVFIHYSKGDAASADQAAKLADLLEERGFEVVEIRPVPFEIGKPSVRYFFTDNRAAATQVADLTGTMPPLAGLARRGPTDFTGYQPKPQPGTLEVWLPTG